MDKTTLWTIAKISALRDLEEHTCHYIQTALPKIYSHELLATIFSQPCCHISNLVHKGIAKRQTASEYSEKLVEAGVLVEQQTGKEKLFLHPKLLNLLRQDDNQFTKYGANA